MFQTEQQGVAVVSVCLIVSLTVTPSNHGRKNKQADEESISNLRERYKINDSINK